MVIATPTDPNPEEKARRLALALDAIEAELDKLDLGVEPGAVIAALSAPVSAFDTAAKGA
jgi:hypothetical protein